MIFITALFFPVVFAIDVVDNLEVEVTVIEEGIVVELIEKGLGDGGTTTSMFIGMNHHS